VRSEAIIKAKVKFLTRWFKNAHKTGNLAGMASVMQSLAFYFLVEQKIALPKPKQRPLAIQNAKANLLAIPDGLLTHHRARIMWRRWATVSHEPFRSYFITYCILTSPVTTLLHILEMCCHISFCFPVIFPLCFFMVLSASDFFFELARCEGFAPERFAGFLLYKSHLVNTLWANKII
jgi:hypothetical protein